MTQSQKEGTLIKLPQLTFSLALAEGLEFSGICSFGSSAFRPPHIKVGGLSEPHLQHSQVLVADLDLRGFY